MGDVVKTISVDRALAELDGPLAEIERLVMTAPVDRKGKVLLAATVAARFYGITAAAMDLTLNDVEEIAAYIGGVARRLKSSS